MPLAFRVRVKLVGDGGEGESNLCMEKLGKQQDFPAYGG